MPELLLHMIWSRGIFRAYPQETTDHRPIEVRDTGVHNLDAGPDFFTATISIGGQLWTGNVEIHLKSSDWYKHHHHLDPVYDTVVLHVVREADREVYNSRGEKITQCELQYPRESESLESLLADRNSLCSRRLMGDDSLLNPNWKSTLLHDRLLKKSAAVNQLLLLTHNAWDQAFFITLAHNFGFHTNGLPMEMMARQTPLSCLQKHRSSLLQLEAILFGQSGLLNDDTATDDYSCRLLKEYRFLQKKFNLVPITSTMWKMLRMRPLNFPHIRIAQFAALLYQSEFMLSKVLQAPDLPTLRGLFQVRASEYWQTHYRFGAEVPAKEGRAARGALGKSAIDSLIINTVVPYRYAWGNAHMDNCMTASAVELLHRLPKEKNSIVQQWCDLGIAIQDAADSQTFIHLHQEYCVRQRCLSCDVGYQIFTPEMELEMN